MLFFSQHLIEGTFNKYKMDFTLKFETKIFEILLIHNKLKLYVIYNKEMYVIKK